MNLVCELSDLPFHAAVQSWRENSLTSGGYWVRHLWFMIVLLYFSCVAALLASKSAMVRAQNVPNGLDSWASRRFLTTMLILAVVIGAWEALALEGFYAAGLATMWPQQILRLDETIIYAPWFMLGGVLLRAPATLRRMTTLSLPIIFVAIAGTVLWLLVHEDVPPMVERFIGSFAALAMTQLLLSSARALLDRPIPLVRRFTEASFVIYLFHLPLITLFVWLAQSIPVAPLLKALAIMILSLGISYGIWVMIGRVRTMTLLFEGIVLPRRRTIEVPAS
jgi:glucan biosynthesis protein C